MANPVAFGRVKFLNANTNLHGAWDLRPSVHGHGPGVGVAGYEDFRVMPRQLGASMSVDVGKTAVGLMTAFVPGSTRGGQGLYECSNIDWGAPTADTYEAQLNVDVSANSSGNPRLDMVVLEVLDSLHTGASNALQIRVVAGTATAGATLDNRTGAAALPASSILLADVIVANGETTIDAVDIRDRRPFALAGVIPPLLTDVDMVAFVAPNAIITTGATAVHASHDLFQSAVLMYLPRRIVGATRIRWKYAQNSGTAMAGNYVLALFDASGRGIVNTGTVAWAGAVNTWQVRSETIAATTFEAGWYYVFMGNDSTAGVAVYHGVSLVIAGDVTTGGTMPNMALRLSTGGTTVPTTVLGMTDTNGLTAATAALPVPLVSLSVG